MHYGNYGNYITGLGKCMIKSSFIVYEVFKSADIEACFRSCPTRQVSLKFLQYYFGATTIANIFVTTLLSAADFEQLI